MRSNKVFIEIMGFPGERVRAETNEYLLSNYMKNSSECKGAFAVIEALGYAGLKHNHLQARAAGRPGTN